MLEPYIDNENNDDDVTLDEKSVISFEDVDFKEKWNEATRSSRFSDESEFFKVLVDYSSIPFEVKTEIRTRVIDELSRYIELKKKGNDEKYLRQFSKIKTRITTQLKRLVVVDLNNPFFESEEFVSELNEFKTMNDQLQLKVREYVQGLTS